MAEDLKDKRIKSTDTIRGVQMLTGPIYEWERDVTVVLVIQYEHGIASASFNNEKCKWIV